MRELLRVIGRHSLNDRLQNNALRRIGDRFGNIVDLNAVLFEMILIKRDLLLVAPDAVGFPDDQRIEAMLCGICKHALKLLSVVILSRLCSVAVFEKDGKAVRLSVFPRLRKLALDGLLTLPMTGIAGINNCIHSHIRSFAIGGRPTARRTISLLFSSALS